jgi:hypothetical protein
MFCSKCGKENTGDETFCSSCGNALKTSVNDTAPNSTYTDYTANPPGKTMIKVSSIIYIIIGGIAALVGVIGLGNFSDAGKQMARALDVEEGILFVMLLMQTANYIMAVIAGVVGLLNANKLEKAQLCFTFGIVMAFVQGCNFIGQISTIGFNIMDTLTLALPVFFIMGAHKNKQAL